MEAEDLQMRFKIAPNELKIAKMKMGPEKGPLSRIEEGKNRFEFSPDEVIKTFVFPLL